VSSDLRHRRRDRRAHTLTGLILIARGSFHSRYSPGKVGWWRRLFAALLFAFYVNFIPIHLATDSHLDDSLTRCSVFWPCVALSGRSSTIVIGKSLRHD